MYILLELGPSIKSLYFGDNVHVEILYSEVHGCIWSIVAYVRNEEWINVKTTRIYVSCDRSGQYHCKNSV